MTDENKTKAGSDVVAVAKNTMTGDMRDIVLDILRDKTLTGKAWKDMTEDQQKDVVREIGNRIQGAVARAIDIIHSDGQKHIKAILKQVVVKDGYKGVFECSSSHELRHKLADAQGKTILVVITDEADYEGERAGVEYDKDQKELPVDETEADGIEQELEDETNESESYGLEKEADELT